jgi:hypothetical protein
MKRKTKELVLLKTGDYMLDMSKLVFGGLVLVVILQIESLSNRILLSIGILTCTLSVLFGLLLIILSQTNKKKGA